MSESTELTKLKSFLNTLFQFENQDLDFGIYKILNFKREAIKTFIDTLLVDEVKSQLNILEESERENLKKQLDELVKDEVIKGFVESKDDKTKEVLKTVSKEKIENYLTLKEQHDSHVTTSNAEPVIYNHLTEFFKRYYDKGDFISKRRYSKNEKYVVPYNGEETYFYWANQDQYYIKSSEFFSKYSFKVLVDPNKECIVNFKLAEAQEESGNVKSESNKYFVLSKNPIEQTKDEINIFFEYCSITDEEKKSFGKNQEELNTNATDMILKSLEKNPAYTELKSIKKSEKNGKDDKSKKKEKSKLKYELDRYTNRNKYDFFIHEDLKGFLSRELDFYIKNEILYLDDLSLFDSNTHLEKIKLHLNIIKTFKHIADKIIDFVSQIENFQKKLWEKKKFVICTNYVITLDKLSEYTSKDFMEEIAKDILKNKDQINEWKELFGDEIFKDWKNIKVSDLSSNMYSFKKLPIDTKHFSNEFKWNMLIEISKKKNIEEKLNGLLLHSDNFHGLKLLSFKYIETIDCIYIDPPFNLGDSKQFLYKVDFKDSSWTSLLKNRFEISKELLSNKGLKFIRCDYNGNTFVHLLADQIFGDNNFRNELIVNKSNKQGEIDKKFNPSTESLFLYSKNSETNINPQYKLRIKNLDWMDMHSPKENKDSHSIKFKNKIYIAPKGRHWTFSQDKLILMEKDHRIKAVEKEYTDVHGNKNKMILQYLPSSNETIDSNWTDINAYSSTTGFQTENSEILLDRVIKTGSKENDTVLDYFMGSGTTQSVAQKLNRKWIGMEAGEQINNVVIPRLKKVLFGIKSGISKDVDYKGSGFFKYQKLEQYEDSLENIAFTKAIDDKQLKMYKDYIPKYFLEFETSESKTFLNTEEMKNPFDYKLKVFDNYDYVEQSVDLIETFNYLIGLYVSKYQIENDQKRDYYFVSGKSREGKDILVIWRDVNKLDFVKDKEFLNKQIKNFTYNTLYVNSQCSLEGYIQIETVFKNKIN